MKTVYVSHWLSSVAAASLLAVPGSAMAQEAADPATDEINETAADSITGDAIIVTGSRVARSGFNAPTPMTVIGSELAEGLGQNNIAETIKLIPQNIPAQSDTNVGYLNSANSGSSFVNLRGLNPNSGTRTLTLVNTRRFVPSSDGGAVDLNVIPSVLIERVETVTGGASAAYGSDAVAGVVNIILDQRFTGFKSEVNYGQTARGEGKTWFGSLAYGSSFAEDRGHFAVAVEYQDQGGIGACSDVREWCAESWDIFKNEDNLLTNGSPSGYNIPGSPGFGLPNYVVGPNSRLAANDSRGVTRNRGPAPIEARNIVFSEDGLSIRAFDQGDFVASNGLNSRQGGEGESIYADSALRASVKRFVAYGFGSYDLTPDWTLSSELTYAHREASARIGTTGIRSTYFVNADNAFLPEELKTLLNGASFSLGKDFDSQIETTNSIKADIFRGLLAVKGELGGSWVLDAYYQYGTNTRKQVADRARVNTPFIYALDAVVDPNTGDIVCAETLEANPDPVSQGCVPMNLFGTSNLSQEAIDYVYRPIYEDFNFRQHAASVSVRGSLFEGRGAGPVGVAAGIDFRSESGDVYHHDIPNYEDYGLTFGLDYAGSIKVFETFGEVSVPLFRDSPIGKSLEIDVAGRWTRNTSHNLVTDEKKTINALSWKVGGVYQPFDMLRFRATRSRDIRVAGFRELFEIQAVAEAGSPQGIVDNGNIPGSPGLGDDDTEVINGGSFALGAEKADTTTVGAVFEPSFIPGLRLGVDWYEIKIRDAVTQVARQGIVDYCEDYNVFCDRITYASPTDITFIDARLVNLGKFTARGLDIEMEYRVPLDRIFARSDGQLNLRVLGTYQYDFLIQPSTDAPAINFAGQSAQQRDNNDFNPAPKWRWTGFLSYKNGPFTATTAVRHVGSGKLDVTKTGPEDPGYDPALPNSISTNRVKSATYVSLGLTYALPAFGQAEGLELFGVVDNLFDKDPPIAPGGGRAALGSAYPTNPIHFDTLGMRWKVGARLKF
jgi:outer membrane receptor protein involved in Fe transport